MRREIKHVDQVEQDVGRTVDELVEEVYLERGGGHLRNELIANQEHRNKLINEPRQDHGSKKVRPRRRSNRSSTRGQDTGKITEQDEEDSLDEVIEEVYMELQEATETRDLITDNEAAAVKEHHQVQDIGKVMVENEQEIIEQCLSGGGQSGGIEIRDHTQAMQNRINQHCKLRLRPSSP